MVQVMVEVDAEDVIAEIPTEALLREIGSRRSDRSAPSAAEVMIQAADRLAALSNDPAAWHLAKELRALAYPEIYGPNAPVPRSGSVAVWPRDLAEGRA